MQVELGGDFKGQNSLLSQGRILRIKGFRTKKARCFRMTSEENAKVPHTAFQTGHSEAPKSPPAGLL